MVREPGQVCAYAHAHPPGFGERLGSNDDSKVIVISDPQGQLPSRAQVLARHTDS